MVDDLALMRDQRAICEREAVAFDPPSLEQLCAVSVGVYEGELAHGVRYHAPPHMSGWYVTTDRYDGDVHSLIVEHVRHLVERRPDIAPLLALPPGYRFTSDGTLMDVRFDDAVANAGS